MFPVWTTDEARTAVKSAGSKWRIKAGQGDAPGVTYRLFSDVIAGFHNAPSGSLVDGKGNCAFVDGHVAPAKPEDSFSLAWPLRPGR